jgi:hypothetical protein
MRRERCRLRGSVVLRGDRTLCAAHRAPDTAVSPAAGTRSPVASQAPLHFQLHLPAGFLDGGIQLADLLCQIVGLCLKSSDFQSYDPAHFFDAIPIRRFCTGINHALESAVPKRQAIALGKRFRKSLAAFYCILQIGLINGDHQLHQFDGNSFNLPKQVNRVFRRLFALLHDSVLLTPRLQGSDLLLNVRPQQQRFGEFHRLHTLSLFLGRYLRFIELTLPLARCSLRKRFAYPSKCSITYISSPS